MVVTKILTKKKHSRQNSGNDSKSYPPKKLPIQNANTSLQKSSMQRKQQKRKGKFARKKHEKIRKIQLILHVAQVHIQTKPLFLAKIN